MSFADDYYANHGGLTPAEYVARHIRGSAVEIDRIACTVAAIPADTASLLDVGAGHGVLLAEYQAARGVRGVGIEITPAKVEYAQSCGVDLRLGTAEKLPFDDGAFDTVVACEVIEHLPFGIYEAALAEMARVARRAVVLSVPNEEDRPFVRCPYCGARINPYYHFRSFSAASMRGIVPGFGLVSTVGVGTVRVSPLLSLGRRLLDRAWPLSLVCACCGYRSPTPSASTSVVPAATGGAGLQRTARRIARWLPASCKPNWLIAVYARGGQG